VCIGLKGRLFSDINISQGIVAKCLRCGELSNESLYCTFTAEHCSERISNLAQNFGDNMDKTIEFSFSLVYTQVSNTSNKMRHCTDCR